MAKQYQKSCRDCGKTIHMLEQSNGQWRAYDDAEHKVAHECKKNQGSSLSTGQADTTQRPLGNSAPTNSPLSPTPAEILKNLLDSRELENKVRLVARNEIEKMLKKAMAF